MTELASYELEGSIATITMDDGKVNAFSIPMLKALHTAFDRAERDGAIVVLTGRENYFSAGFDLKVFAGGEVDQVIEMLTLGATLCRADPVLPYSYSHCLQWPRGGGWVLHAARGGSSHRNRGPLSDRPQRGQDRPNRPLVRDRARAPASTRPISIEP